MELAGLQKLHRIPWGSPGTSLLYIPDIIVALSYFSSRNSPRGWFDRINFYWVETSCFTCLEMIVFQHLDGLRDKWQSRITLYSRIRTLVRFAVIERYFMILLDILKRTDEKYCMAPHSENSATSRETCIDVHLNPPKRDRLHPEPALSGPSSLSGSAATEHSRHAENIIKASPLFPSLRVCK